MKHIGSLRIGSACIAVRVSPAAAADVLRAHLEEFFVQEDPRALLDIHFVPGPAIEVPAGPDGTVRFTLLDGLAWGWSDPEGRTTSLCALEGLLAPHAIRAFSHLLIPSFYAAHYDGDELRGVLLHASAVEVVPGAAGVFLAASQGGKSTVAEIARATHPVLHEEVVVLTESADGTFAAGVGPWPGLRTSGVGLRLPVRGLFLIEKADGHALFESDGAEAHGRVLAQIVFAQDFHDRSPHDVLENMARFCERLCARVTPDVLRFRPDAGFLELVESRVRTRRDTA